MKYCTVLYKNPMNTNSQGKYYPSPVYSDEINLTELASEISLATTLTPSDVRAVLNGFQEIIPKYLMHGFKVRLNDLGLFKLSFGGKGHLTAEEVTAADIERVRIIFTADSGLRKKVLPFITWEKTGTTVEQPADSSGN